MLKASPEVSSLADFSRGQMRSTMMPVKSQETVPKRKPGMGLVMKAEPMMVPRD